MNKNTNLKKVNLDSPSESGQEQDFDKLKTNILYAMYCCSSAKSYLR